ncbi:hypothetical protein [Tenacibaculum ovolyticum]|uniref:hypothetical protein n=1 Tax=Tenacibaculum ovolyticum TaxID=104270 RepID=UPI003BAD077A
MKKYFKLLLVLSLLLSKSIYSQLGFSSFIKNPVESKHELRYKIDKKRNRKQFKFYTQIEDSNGILNYFNLKASSVEVYLSIKGQIRVDNPEEADVIYKYVFNSIDVVDQEVYDTGVVISHGGYSRPYYRARGVFKINVCREMLYPSEAESNTRCETLGDLERLRIETEKVLDKNKAVKLWNSSKLRQEVGSELIKNIKRDFDEINEGYEYETEHKIELFTAVFKQKDSRKHKKGTSDKYVKEFNKLLWKYNYDYSNYFRNNCYKVDSLKSTENCINNLKQKIYKGRKDLREAVSFWKNELTSKYFKKGKKANIRRAMALNLFTCSMFLNDIKNAELALGILKEERYGHVNNDLTDYANKSSYEDLEKVLGTLKDKRYQFAPKYYSYYSKFTFGDKVEITRGSDFPLEN